MNSTKHRRQESYRVRTEAAELARSRSHPDHQANPDEQRYASEHYPMSFTKGLTHDENTGLVSCRSDFEAFRKAINEGFIDPFTENVPVPDCENGRRQWEAPTAGVAYDLEGPDAQAVTMPPAPELGSKELSFEMAEVYELALVRDVPFKDFVNTKANNTEANNTEANNTEAKEKLEASIGRLNDYYDEDAMSRPRKTANGNFTPQTVFRGSSPGVEVGPYLSQFLLIGTRSDCYLGGSERYPGFMPADGKIVYGAQLINQRVATAEHEDFMIDEPNWLNIQNGCESEETQTFNGSRFIATPRDLTTYVHVDALYQAYLNACIILLNMKTPFDPSFGALSGQSRLNNIKRNAGGFALYGGPHILTLVTEVATRALKAVRYQKFNNHLRLRPEALAGRLEKACRISAKHPRSGKHFMEMRKTIKATIKEIVKKNQQNLSLKYIFNEPCKKAIDDMIDKIKDSMPNIPDELIENHINGIVDIVNTNVDKVNTNLNSKNKLDSTSLIGRIKKIIDTYNNCKDCFVKLSKFLVLICECIYEAINHLNEIVSAGGAFLACQPNIDEAGGTSNNKVGPAFLPMAFPEGSPMHPSYGAGHAVVAGACVTILKAFFDTSTVFVRVPTGDRDFPTGNEVFRHPKAGDQLLAYTPKADGSELIPSIDAVPLTLEGELNKLAANISIGRNMAGVHFFSDYYDSLRMGEEIAIGILEEQALTYPTDRFVLSVPTFDGKVRRIGAE